MMLYLSNYYVIGENKSIVMPRSDPTALGKKCQYSAPPKRHFLSTTPLITITNPATSQMAKTKPGNKSKKVSNREKSNLNRVAPSSNKPSAPAAQSAPSDLILLATQLLHSGQPVEAVKPAQQALSQVNGPDSLPVLELLGEIHVELGDIDEARDFFLQAAKIDSEAGGEGLAYGAEKFLWLAQLSAQGGTDSVQWYQRGAARLRLQIQALQETKGRTAGMELEAEERRRKLAVALCGVVEVYMTDLSWEADAEAKCETLVTEATMVAPAYPEPLQTLANVRISQQRMEEARSALKRSIELWVNLEPENEIVPDFPSRVSLARLLMEADMDTEAIEVLERLVGEDDGSVEVWYLGGWGLYIMGEKQKAGEIKEDEDGEGWRISWISSRQWLQHSLRLFDLQDYEDERLGEHAKELLAVLNKELGGVVEEEEEGDDWEDDDASSEDEEMTGA